MTETQTAVEEVSLDTVREILTDVVPELMELNHMPLTGDTSKPSREVGEATRRLLLMADQLMLASNIVRNEYWHARGMKSYDL